MTRSLQQQGGFGESQLVPVAATFAICIVLLSPAMQLLFANMSILIAIGMCLIAIVGSLCLSSQCFGDFLNLGIVIVFAVLWAFSADWILELFKETDIGIFRDEGMLRISLIIQLYFPTRHHSCHHKAAEEP